MGPFLFACGIHDAIRSVQAEHSGSYHVFFLDDGHMVGLLSDLDQALMKLRELLGASTWS